MNSQPKPAVSFPLVVTVKHTPFLDWFDISYNGQSEELTHEETLAWFKAHGAANMDKVNDLICSAWNFGKAVVTIKNPVTPALPDGSPVLA